MTGLEDTAQRADLPDLTMEMYGRLDKLEQSRLDDTHALTK